MINRLEEAKDFAEDAKVLVCGQWDLLQVALRASVEQLLSAQVESFVLIGEGHKRGVEAYSLSNVYCTSLYFLGRFVSHGSASLVGALEAALEDNEGESLLICYEQPSSSGLELVEKEVKENAMTFWKTMNFLRDSISEVSVVFMRALLEVEVLLSYITSNFLDKRLDVV